MLNTTPASLPSISPDLLLAVSGGCHKKCCPQPAPAIQQQIVQMPPSQPPQVLPQAAPPAPSGPSGDVVTTNVSINGQPVAS